MNNKNYSCFSKVFLLVALLCCVSTEAFAFDFSAKNSDEVTIYYNRITNNDVVEAVVTYKSTGCYSGVVNIPATVEDDRGATLSVTSIGDYAFDFCRNLTSVTIPNSVTSIGKWTFSDCSSLKSVTIPNSVTKIGDYAFNNCSSLTSIEVEDGNTNYSIDGNCLIETTSNTLIRACNLASITIPNSVTKIDDYAFYYCTDLTSVTIPNSVTSIGDYAFDGCSSLTSITIPNSVTSIGDGAFVGCSSLSSVTIGKSVTNIKSQAFDGCSSLTSITIPNSVTSIDEWAFSGCSSLSFVTIGKSVTTIGFYAFCNCTKLNEVILRGKSLPTCSSDAFYGISSIANLYCRKVLLDAWEDKDPWSTSSLFTNITAKPFSVTIPECGYATGCFYDDLDFTGLDESKGIYAYIVSAFSPKENTVLLTRAKKIPAETGFVVYGKADTYTIPATTTDYVYSNMLVSVVDKTTISQTDGEYTNYTLHKKQNSNEVAFVLVDAKGEDVSGYKAYLQVPTSAVSASNNPAEAKTSLGLSFDDDEDDGTTGISEIKEQSNRTSSGTIIYNLNGQRKQSLTKGLNIVNGKKIFIK